MQINQIEGVPSAICEVCKSKVVICTQFIQQCLRTDRKIRQLYAKHFKRYAKLKEDYDTPENTPLECEEIEEIEIIDFITCGEDDLSTKNNDIITLKDEENGNVLIEVIEVLEETDFSKADVENTSKDDIPSEKSKEEHAQSTAAKTTSFTVVKKAKKLVNGSNLEEATTEEDVEVRLSAKKIQSQHGDTKKYKKECPICGTWQQNLTQHMVVHTGIKKHVCEYCNKAFAQRGNLNIHLRIHTGNKPLKCVQCDKRFGDPSALKLHMVIVMIFCS